MLREAVQALRRSCHTKPVARDEGITGRGTTTEIFVGWEVDEGMVNGTYITIRTWTPKIDGVFNEVKTLFEIYMDSKSITLNSFEGSKVLP